MVEITIAEKENRPKFRLIVKGNFSFFCNVLILKENKVANTYYDLRCSNKITFKNQGAFCLPLLISFLKFSCKVIMLGQIREALALSGGVMESKSMS